MPYINNTILPKPIDNDEVIYCKHCLSLRIKAADEADFCDECGSTSLHSSTLDHWEELYELKYGEKFLELSKKKRYGRI